MRKYSILKDWKLIKSFIAVYIHIHILSFYLSLCFKTTYFVKIIITFYFFIIDEYVYLIMEFGISRMITHMMLTLAEMVIFKIIYIFKFSILVAVNEYFFTNFVTLLNCMINFELIIMRYTLGEVYRTRMYFRMFAKPTEFYDRIPWP